MLDVTAHMLLLLQQAQIKDERPYDGSFLPLSLSLACLLRQLPPGLAPPSGVLSFHQLDRLPDHILEQKLQKLLDDDDSLKALNFVSSIVRYVKIARALLSVCHEHLVNKRSSLKTTQSVIGIVVGALGDDQEQGEEELDELRDWTAKQGSPGKLSTNDDCDLSQFSQNQKVKGTGNDAMPSSAAIPPARVVNASEVMKRAVSRDIGNGSAVLEIMRKYPSDERIQSRGVRALKAVVRKFISESEPESKGGVKGSSVNRKRSQQRRSTCNRTRARQRNQQISNELSASSDDDSTSEIEKAPADQADEKGESETMKSLRDAIQHVIGNMQKHPDSLPLQRDGLLCLSEYVSKDARHVAMITSSGGIVSVMDAMARLPDDQEANVGGLSVLAHPQIADKSILRVNPESRRLVLSAMKRFPLSEQIQGLSCLALANLSLRHDESMFEIVAKGGLETVVAAMKRFPKNSLVQAAGCWLFGIVSVKNEEMTTACLDAGALPVCERARVRFPDDSKVQQNALFAIHNMVSRDEDEEPKQPQASQECTLQ